MNFRWRYVKYSEQIPDVLHRVFSEHAEGDYVLEVFYMKRWLLVYVNPPGSPETEQERINREMYENRPSRKARLTAPKTAT